MNRKPECEIRNSVSLFSSRVLQCTSGTSGTYRTPYIIPNMESDVVRGEGRGILVNNLSTGKTVLPAKIKINFDRFMITFEPKCGFSKIRP